MRILVLNYEYPPLGGGAAPVCRDLAVCMAQKGHQVTVVTMGYPGLPAFEDTDGVKIHRLHCLRSKAHVCMPWEQLTFMEAAQRFLKRHLESHTYDVCHTHFVIPTGPVALWIRKNYGIPYVITAHGSDVEGYNEKPWMKAMHRLLRPAWRQVVRNAYAVCAPSRFLLGLMEKEMPWKRYVYIPNGFDPEKYKSDAFFKEKRILLMGRLQKSKNFQTVLQAFMKISQEAWGDWQADILGDGPFHEELELMTKAAGLSDRVKYRGWIENGSEAQLGYLKKAAIYISASHFENCPMALLEAAAAGCRPVLSDIEGHRQFFDTETEADFFPADDAESLSEILDRLMRKDPETLRTSIGMEKYSLQLITDRYLRLLSSCMQKDRRKAGTSEQS